MPNPDPTGVRRILNAIKKAPNGCGCPQCKELDAAIAAMRVAELERVVEAARDALVHKDGCHACDQGDDGADCTCFDVGNVVNKLRAALAALDAKETT